MSAKGGITKGKSHKEGGIPMVVKSTGQQVELEGGEGVINKRNMSSEKKFEFEGQEKTICEIASEINSADGNGVQIDCDNVTGKKYEYATGGKILNEDEEESFKEWMDDGNVVEFETDVYSTQDAQYSNKLKGMDELRKYFRKEFLSDSYEGGGSIDVETYDYNQLIGKYVNIHSMGVELPSEHKVEGVMFSSPQFRYRQLTLKFDRGIAPIEIEDIPKFLNNDIVFVNDNKEDFGVQLIPNQFAEGGGVENMPKSYQVKRTRELSIINEYLTKAGGEPMTEQDVESVLNHYNPTYFYEIESEVFSLSGADEENLKVIEKRRLGEAFMFFKRKPKMAEGGGVSSLGHFTAVANLGTRKIKENLDNFQEAQEFMDRMAEKNAISVEMTKINQEGKRQTIFYEFDGENWVIKNKSDIYANGGDVRNMSWFQDFKKQELKRGTEHEMEHIDTIREFKKKGVSDREVAKAIAKDHLDEDENYYIELSEMEKESKKLDDTLYEYEKHKSHRKNAHKYAQGGYMGDARVKVHLMFTEDFTGILRKPNGSYLTESVFPKNKVSTFNFIHNDGRTTALEFSNTGAYMLVPSDIINVVGFDEQFANGGSVSPYQSVATDDNDKLILNKLRTIDDIYSVTSKEKQLLSSFKGDNVVNQLSNAMIQKIYSVLFKYHNIEHPIKNLYLSNIGVGNILLFAPNYIDHTICSYDKDNRFSEIEEEISSIVTLGKRASILTSEVELHNIDAIIHVYAQTNPISDSLVPLLFKINKTGGTALGVAEFTSREKLNQFQKTIAQNQGGMGLNQMMMFKKSNDYLIVNEGITEEGNYTLMYVMNKM
jgi:hypothetical protein